MFSVFCCLVIIVTLEQNLRARTEVRACYVYFYNAQLSICWLFRKEHIKKLTCHELIFGAVEEYVLETLFSRGPVL
jgi:hypothetical protein